MEKSTASFLTVAPDRPSAIKYPRSHFRVPVDKRGRREEMTNPKWMRLLLIMAVLASAELLQAQTYTDLHDFNSTDGCCANYPSMMAQAEDGSIWGATTSGGASFQGNIFKITPSGTFTDVHDFVFAQGSGPQGGISMGMDGNFYGTTYEGGSHSAG